MSALTPAPPECPNCGQPSKRRWRPFCSARCKQLDLGRWLGESYRIAGDEPADMTADQEIEIDDTAS